MEYGTAAPHSSATSEGPHTVVMPYQRHARACKTSLVKMRRQRNVIQAITTRVTVATPSSNFFPGLLCFMLFVLFFFFVFWDCLLT